MMLTSCEVELGLTGLTSTSRSSRTTCAKSLALLRSSDSVLSIRPRILWSWARRSHLRSGASHPVVELGLTGLTSTSRSIRTTCAKSLALLRSSDSVLSVRPRILCSWVRNRRNGVRFPKRPHDSFRVPSGVPVQRSISRRDCSHPVISSDLKTRLIVQRSFGTLRSRP